MTKNKIRDVMKTKRNLMNREEVFKWSELIGSSVFNKIRKEKIQIAHIYLSINNEVDTRFVIKKIRVHMPDVEIYTSLNCNSKMVSHKKIIFNNNEYEICPDIIKTINPDLVIVPGVAFDRRLNRIGYGGGYYDRFLKKTKCLKIGLAYSWQMIEDLPIEKHDICLDFVVTENEVFEQKSGTKIS